ncbi:BolA family protein [Scleromatobacter humisilvae]|uniref:BolA family transcriptional regulator n=1 Tax=Scleromatobacter humisilvae TaxID=2897159 RepID=A0A9X2C076_9BURK|nr:BolA family protein [Scleromatobacter humisilvae]MCK9687438.1 BolA family transcriptional regulator [Scleromatobacter humisilvae]
MTAATLHDALTQALTERLQPVALELEDDSAAHAGHAGARSGAHFNLRIVSARFAGLPRVARHRLVYDALRPWMAEGVHALAIDARTPDEV